MVRFTVLQKGKHRAIDDGKSNGANAATTLRETVTTPSFLFPAIVARASRAAALAAGFQPPGLTSALSALSDLTMAYRTIPSSQPWLTCFGHLDTGRTPPAPSYYFLPGHNFGLTSAVVNFNRYAETVAVLSSIYGGVVADHYYDDFIIVDTVAGGSSAFDFLHDLALDLGIDRPWARREIISSLAFYLQAAGLGTSVFFDYVPSKANIADLPSCGASRQVPLHLRDLLLDSSVPDSLVSRRA